MNKGGCNALIRAAVWIHSSDYVPRLHSTKISSCRLKIQQSCCWHTHWFSVPKIRWLTNALHNSKPVVAIYLNIYIFVNCKHYMITIIIISNHRSWLMLCAYWCGLNKAPCVFWLLQIWCVGRTGCWVGTRPLALRYTPTVLVQLSSCFRPQCCLFSKRATKFDPRFSKFPAGLTYSMSETFHYWFLSSRLCTGTSSYSDRCSI